MIQALRTAALRLPELRNKILLTIMILLIYQFGTHIPVLGVNKVALEAVLNNQTAGGFINVLNLLSGGAVKNFSVLANGVYPYITASIIFNLLTPIIPALEAMQREPGGQEKIQRYTYFLAIPMAVLQSLAQVGIFTALANGQQIIPGFGSDILLTASVIITMTAGTMFAVWLGELITEQGIGNGTSLIIFSGIVATAPTNLLNLLAGNPDRAIYNIVLFVLIVVVSVLVIIYIQEGVRRIPVQYGRRVRGNKQYQMGRDSHIPMKVNPVGMIPLIFSQSIITFPALIIGFQPEPGTFLWQIQNTLGNHQGALYWIIFFLMTVAFTFFYADVMVGNYKLAETLQRNGGFIPGIRPGKKTDDYILAVTRRITIVGALFLGIIAVVPGIVDLINSVVFPLEAAASTSNNPALVLSGSGLIIVVGVVIETMRQLEAQLVMRNYEGFMS